MTLQPVEPPRGPDVASLAIAGQAADGVARIVQWAQSAEAAHQLAELLCRTTFCPEQFREKPGDATAAILAGGEVGLSPMSALNAFDIIQGRAAPRAITLRAVVQSLGHEVELVESTDHRCIMRGRRRGSQEWQRITWTMDRARRLKLSGKPNWQNQPQAMLLARATSELCRLVAADAIMGIGYTVEELDDPEAPVGARRSVQRRTVASAPAAPSVAPSAETDPVVQPQGPRLPGEQEETDDMTADARIALIDPLGNQMKRLHASFHDAGLQERDECLAYATGIIGRTLASTKDLTMAEATEVIESLVVDRTDKEPSESETES